MSLEDYEDAFALSPMQSGMLFDTLSAPDKDLYTTYIICDFTGDVDSERLRLAWQSVFSRHQALRAEFHWQELEQPLQVIVKNPILPWKVIDWCAIPADQQPSMMQSLLTEERRSSIDLSAAPLSRFILIRRSQTEYSLLWVVHHLLADGASTPVILDQVMQQYMDSVDADPGLVQSDKNVFQYSQYIQWLSVQDSQVALEHWKTRLKNAEPTPVKLRQRRQANYQNNHQVSQQPDQQPDQQVKAQDQTDNVPSVTHCISAEQTQDINHYCRENTISLSTLFHGVWSLLLREYSGCSTVLFASTVSGRHSEVDGMDEAVGLYLNAQPRIVDTDVERDVVAWLQSIQHEIHSSAPYDFLSLGDAQQTLNNQTAEDPFDSILTIGAHPKTLNLSQSDMDISLSNIEYQVVRSHYPLALIVTPGDSLEMTLVYHEDKFYAKDCAQLLEYVERILSEVLNAPRSLPPHEVSASVAMSLAKVTDNQLRVTDSSHRLAAESAHGCFESIADKIPEEIALRCGGVSTNYIDLEKKANKIANMLTHKIGALDVVSIGLMLPRSVAQIAGMLGILKATHAYTPLDTEYPEERLRHFLQSSRIKHVLTTHEFAALVESCGATAILNVDAENYSEDRIVGSEVNADNLAYVMYTSGSTGEPKGVKITHGNLMYSTDARIQYYNNQSPRYLLLSSIAFDSSVAGIYWCLCGGGTLVLPMPNEEKDIDSIAGTIDNEKVSHTLCLPSYYQLLLDHGADHALESLEVVIVAGEACPAELVSSHFEKVPDVRLFNEYGPTEACVWSSVKEFDGVVTDEVTIGKAIGSTHLQVINEHGNICPQGVEGEIVIGGPGVSSGYINDEAQTSLKFMPNPVKISDAPIIYKTGDSGFFNHKDELVFNGRTDRQLKIRGFRIEPGEIEGVLNQHQGIARSVVVAIEQSALTERPSDQSVVNDLPMRETASRQVLIAYYVGSQHADISEGISTTVSPECVQELHNILDERELSDYCHRNLAAHMCPVRIVALNKIPLLANGKIAYAELPIPARQARQGTQESAEHLNIARQLGLILEELIGVSNVDPADNFFAIGGDSITAIQFIAKARQAGFQIDVAAVSRSGTIAEIASNCVAHKDSPVETTSKVRSSDNGSDTGSDQADFSASGLNKEELDDFLDGFSD